MGIWNNAFKMPCHAEPTAEEKDFLGGLAEKVNKRSLGMVTALAFESTRPLHNLGAQGLQFLKPILGPVLSHQDMEKFIKLLENPKAVTHFIDQLDRDGDKPAGKTEKDHVEKRP
ncbi:MAG: hypothetical protein A3J79_03890 [Elusimicrobia bacterium RIFOXYB2_FULL_62_6]|nr:MAG: hypothetical protein A3J79_03890 [Elusimicrobia bacterium RIFOXYB2_FULL_62_6]